MAHAGAASLFAHKDTELRNMLRTQRLDSNGFQLAVLRKSGPCVRNPGGGGGPEFNGHAAEPGESRNPGDG